MILHYGASVAPDPFKDLPSGSATIVGDSQCTSIWIIVPCYIQKYCTTCWQFCPYNNKRMVHAWKTH